MRENRKVPSGQVLSMNAGRTELDPWFHKTPNPPQQTAEHVTNKRPGGREGTTAKPLCWKSELRIHHLHLNLKWQAADQANINQSNESTQSHRPQWELCYCSQVIC